MIIDSWRDRAQRTLTADRYLSAGDHHIRLEYYENTLLAFTRLTWSRIADAPPPVTINNWRGEYFNNTNLTGPGVNYSIVTTLARGDGMTLTHRDAAGNWVRATLSNGTQGWVHAGYIQSAVPINSLPVAN